MNLGLLNQSAVLRKIRLKSLDTFENQIMVWAAAMWIVSFLYNNKRPRELNKVCRVINEVYHMFNRQSYCDNEHISGKRFVVVC